jgi:FkbM family methyltransferase
MASSRMQSFLIGLYGHLHGDAVRQTRVGRWLFERAYIAYKHFVEAGPVAALGNYIHPGSWAIDVGANIGFFAIGFARRVSGGGGVIAIEPEAKNFEALQRRLLDASVADKVIVRCAAAAAESGTLQLQINPAHPGDHRLGSQGIPVEAVTLDALAREYGPSSVSLIKIDVQGAELQVLTGAAELIARDRPALFIEIDDSALRGQGTSTAELVDWLTKRDYYPYHLRRHGDPLPLSREELCGGSGYTDVLFLPSAYR